MSLSNSLARILAALLLLTAAAATAQPALGEPPPDALGRDRDGRPVRLTDYAGKVVVVSFWASWCAPCLEEMALLENLQRRIGGERLAVIGVNWREERFQYRAALRRLDRVQLVLSRDEEGSVAEAYGVDEIPRLFIVDADGRLAHSHAGYVPADSAAGIVAEIEALLPAPAHAKIR